MTINEAYIAMQEGHFITHELFDSNEHLHIDYNKNIRNEIGVYWNEGWNRKKDKLSYQVGWTILSDFDKIPKDKLSELDSCKNHLTLSSQGIKYEDYIMNNI